MDSQRESLRTGSLNMWHALAQGLGTNGPAAVTALFFVGIASLVAGSTPLVVLLAFIVYSGMTVIVYEWSKEVAASHSWVAIQRKGVGRLGAFFGGWGYWYYYMTGYAGFAILGFASFAYVLFPQVGQTYPWLWIPISLIVIAETTILVYFGIKPSTTYVLYTGLAEVVFLIATSIALIVRVGPNNTPTPFTPNPAGGWTPILVSMVLGIATFGGMNSVIPVAEETKDPKRNVPKALVVLALILGITLIMNSYAQTVAFGVSKMSGYAGLPDPGIIIYTTYFGAAVAALYALFVLNSFNSSAVAFANNAVRMSYGLAREGVLFPTTFAKINKHGVPGRNTIISGIINAIVALTAGLIFGPLNGGLFLIVNNTILNYLNHILAGAGLIRYHNSKHTLRIIRHVLIPITVSVALAAAIFYEVYPAPSPPLNYAAYVTAAWIALGFAVYTILRRTNPTAIEKIGQTGL
ncbi:MAG: APC family permease [Thermoprotei archaeon]